MKKKIIYKVVSFITIVFPFVTYLFLSATILNVESNHTINKLGETEVLAYEMEKSLFCMMITTCFSLGVLFIIMMK